MKTRRPRVYTYDDVAALGPCWLKDGRDGRLRRLIGRGLTAGEIAARTDVVAADRRWVLTRLASQSPAGLTELVLWACGCAQDVRNLARDVDVVDTAIQTAVAWMVGVGDPATVLDAAHAADAATTSAASSADAATAYAAYAAAAHAAYAAFTSATSSAHAADAAAAYAAYAASTSSAHAADAYAAYAASVHAASDEQLADLGAAMDRNVP